MRSLGTIRDLAGGRLPPLTRTALAAGLGVFLAALALVRPTDGGQPAVEPLRGGVRWVGKGDGFAEGAVLLDPSEAYMPGKLVSLPEVAFFGPKPTEEAPFPRLDRRLLNDPLKGEVLPMRIGEPTSPSIALSVPLAQADPLVTFGRANLTQSSLPSRAGSFEVHALGGVGNPYISGILPHFESNKSIKSTKESNKAPFFGIYEATIGVDSLGLQGLPCMVKSSGDQGVDQAISRWAAGVPWVKHLPPGSYRLTVVP